MQNLELNTFEYEEDTSLGTLQIEQVENGTKIIVELFPENQSKESFESAEFSQVYDILDLAPCCIYGYDNLNFPYPVGTTEDQKGEVIRAILRGVESMLETTLNLYDFEGQEIYPTLERIRKEYLLKEINSFLKYRAKEYTKIEITLSEETDIGKLENLFRIIDTINETDQTRTQNILKYMGNLAQ